MQPKLLILRLFLFFFRLFFLLLFLLFLRFVLIGLVRLRLLLFLLLFRIVTSFLDFLGLPFLLQFGLLARFGLGGALGGSLLCRLLTCFGFGVAFGSFLLCRLLTRLGLGGSLGGSLFRGFLTFQFRFLSRFCLGGTLFRGCRSGGYGCWLWFDVAAATIVSGSSSSSSSTSSEKSAEDASTSGSGRVLWSQKVSGTGLGPNNRIGRSTIPHDLRGSHRLPILEGVRSADESRDGIVAFQFPLGYGGHSPRCLCLGCGGGGGGGGQRRGVFCHDVLGLGIGWMILVQFSGLQFFIAVTFIGHRQTRKLPLRIERIEFRQCPRRLASHTRGRLLERGLRVGAGCRFLAWSSGWSRHLLAPRGFELLAFPFVGMVGLAALAAGVVVGTSGRRWPDIRGPDFGKTLSLAVAVGSSAAG
mmetsp:Transcript_12203/g.23034  ORF Transcript_12203/g.23034 Transcript_12203/m.23034 type:complete len:415 (-) Transcript_12203:465-1709(-)